jgi:hypothetical protein
MHAMREFETRGRAALPADGPDQGLQLRKARNHGFADLCLFDQLDAAAGDRQIVEQHLIVEGANGPDIDRRGDGRARAVAAVQREFLG